MASASRWRRFAFFDRCTLSLPDDIWDDLVHVTSTTSEKQLQQQQQQLEEEASDEEASDEDATTGNARRRLVFTCASVSFHPCLLPCNNGEQQQQQHQQQSCLLPEALLNCYTPAAAATAVSPTAATTTTTTATRTLSICTSTTANGYNKNATFLSETTSPPSVLSPINSSLAFVYCFPNSKYQPMSPILEKVAQHFFASCNTMACTMNSSIMDTTTSTTTSNNYAQYYNIFNAAANRLGVGTLVLAILSSKDTSLLHIVDLSMRCNLPISQTNTNTNDTTNNKNTTSSPALADQLSAVSMEELEDIDGWRGCIVPFPTEGGTGKCIASIASYSTSYSSKNNNNMVNFDTSTTTTTTTNKQTTTTTTAVITKQQREELGHLYVAVVSNDTTSSTKESSEAVVEITSQNTNNICILVDPHLYLHSSISAATTNLTSKQQYYPKVYRCTTSATSIGKSPYTFTCVDILPPFVVAGTSIGTTLLYTFSPLEQQQNSINFSNIKQELVLRMEISSPDDNTTVKSVNLSFYEHEQQQQQQQQQQQNKNSKMEQQQQQQYPTHIFVCYRRRRHPSSKKSSTKSTTNRTTTTSSTATDTAGTTGICCYAISPNEKQPRSRIDLDTREISNTLTTSSDKRLLQVCWSDGLYTYSPFSKIGIVQPIDGRKIAFCPLPSSSSSELRVSDEMQQQQQQQQQQQLVTEYVLVATSDNKSGRDAVDIYDTTNKLCAFHVLLSPNHRAMQVGGVTTPSTGNNTNSNRRGRSSAIVVTSGGAVVTLTEKDTSDKVQSLLQKNLYAAAISLAFADSYYPLSDIITLYRQYAEHLYRKGDFEASMDQYIHTIGSLEPSYVIFRFLDAPKIPLLVKYLEQLLSKTSSSRSSTNSATLHITELLRTCYLKLGDFEAAEKIVTTSSALSDNISLAIASLVIDKPAEALATLCSLEAPQVAEALSVHGVTLARSLPRETAGIVMSLCDGTYSPSISNQDTSDNMSAAENNNLFMENRKQKCKRYPVSMFTSAFIENTKLLRLVLAHCKRNHCELLPSLRRTHLELTLEEWHAARRNGDYEMEMIRSEEAMTSLTDTYAEDLGSYEALVIVQMAGFAKGEVLLFERLSMSSMLLERYAKEGGERERRQMLAMCCSDHELLADVLSYFVTIASQHAAESSSKGGKRGDNTDDDDDSQGEIVEDIHDDIKEALEMARSQGVLPPVRIVRILAGEGPGQFSTSRQHGGESLERGNNSVPLSVSLKYIGGVLDESSQKIYRLKEDLKEYCGACNSMEAEIASLLAAVQHSEESSSRLLVPNLNINELFVKVRENSGRNISGNMDTLHAQEEFWREMGQSSDRYDTIARFFGKLSIV